MNEITVIMEKLQTEEDLPGDGFQQGLSHTCLAIARNEGQESLSEGFHDHARMQLPLRICLCYLLQELDLIMRSFGVSPIRYG